MKLFGHTYQPSWFPWELLRCITLFMHPVELPILLFSKTPIAESTVGVFGCLVKCMNLRAPYWWNSLLLAILVSSEVWIRGNRVFSRAPALLHKVKPGEVMRRAWVGPRILKSPQLSTDVLEFSLDNKRVTSVWLCVVGRKACQAFLESFFYGQWQ